jgi:PHD/YefM family antitoxin component YafN of YafNO toxin-antitoxin module
MKTLDVSKANKPLAAYAADAQSEPVLITRRGKPLAAVISMAGIDRESLAVSTHPGFQKIIAAARASRARGTTIPAEEMRQRAGVPKRAARKPRRRTST